jgi:hypothetical protein
MILFRPVLRIYAIGDSDKPRSERERKREREAKKKRNENKVAASEKYVSYLASVRAERRGDVSEREREREREKEGE